MRKKILILMLTGLCLSFVIFGGGGFYYNYVIQKNLLELGEKFSEETADHIWSTTEKHVIEDAEQLVQACASQIDSEMDDLREHVKILSYTITRITSQPNKYYPRASDDKIFDRQTTNDPYILFSEEIFYDRSPALDEEIAIAANIEDLLIDLHRKYASQNNSCYIASKKGYFICVDTVGGDELNKPYDARQRIWYKNAQQADTSTFSDIYLDEKGNKAITCAAPYYDGIEFAGVVGIGCDITTWYNLLVKNSLRMGTISFILNAKGKIILSTDEEEFLAVTAEETSLLKNKDEKIARLAKKMISGMTGVQEVDFAGETFYVVFAPLKSTEMSLGLLVPKAEIIKPADKTKKYLLNHFRDSQKDMHNVYLKASIIWGTILLMIFALLVAESNRRTKKFLEPVIALTEGVKEISAGNLEKKLNIQTGDELQTLSESFNTMTDELKTQMANLAKASAERERIDTELDVAKKIQLSMLPKNFSVDERVDLFATMTPAKEVGGDLYDFYMLDENHLFITIADVSGKGVPAALFMVAAITNLRNSIAALDRSDDLKTAINITNDRLCANNDGGLFVTAFSGVLDLTTGIFRYVNAGHNPPLIWRGKNFEELPMDLNFVLGGWENWQYVQQEIQLEAGDEIFLYTDGVTEAVDSAGKFYSLDRLKDFLNKLNKLNSAKELLTDVRESLENFSADAEQADDITMLAVKLKGVNDNGK